MGFARRGCYHPAGRRKAELDYCKEGGALFGRGGTEIQCTRGGDVWARPNEVPLEQAAEPAVNPNLPEAVKDPIRRVDREGSGRCG